MANSIKGTQTEKNLLISFAGESQAHNRYTFYAGIAKKEGLVQISEILPKLPIRRKSTLNASSNFLRVAMSKSLRAFLPVN